MQRSLPICSNKERLPDIMVLTNISVENFPIRVLGGGGVGFLRKIMENFGGYEKFSIIFFGVGTKTF